MSKYFGTDGFRGEARITLTSDHAYKVGRFLGWYYNALRERNGDSNPARIVIGKVLVVARTCLNIACWLDCFWCGCLSAARHYHAVCGVYRPCG